jgi:hypothetical protein
MGGGGGGREAPQVEVPPPDQQDQPHCYPARYRGNRVRPTAAHCTLFAVPVLGEPKWSIDKQKWPSITRNMEGEQLNTVYVIRHPVDVSKNPLRFSIEVWVHKLDMGRYWPWGHTSINLLDSAGTFCLIGIMPGAGPVGRYGAAKSVISCIFLAPIGRRVAAMFVAYFASFALVRPHDFHVFLSHAKGSGGAVA